MYAPRMNPSGDSISRPGSLSRVPAAGPYHGSLPWIPAFTPFLGVAKSKKGVKYIFFL